MKANYDRSITIGRKTTKIYQYHPRADDPLLLKFVYYIFSEIKTQNFRDDALLV